jgi:uncharacterized protein (DUF433 family)
VSGKLEFAFIYPSYAHLRRSSSVGRIVDLARGHQRKAAQSKAAQLATSGSMNYIPIRRNIYEVQMRPELLTPAEAAVIASVTVRDINRVIDEEILPAQFYSLEDGRRIRLAACPLVGFYFHAAKALTAEERLRLIGLFSERMSTKMEEQSLVSWRKTDWTIRECFLTVNLDEFVEKALDRSAKLETAEEMVVEDPAILSGTPVIRGTRIPVYDLVASVAAGVPRERILAAYPGLDETTLDLAVLYAEANPVRGRPRRFVALPTNAVAVAERRVPRRRQT